MQSIVKKNTGWSPDWKFAQEQWEEEYEEVDEDGIPKKRKRIFFDMGHAHKVQEAVIPKGFPAPLIYNDSWDVVKVWWMFPRGKGEDARWYNGQYIREMEPHTGTTPSDAWGLFMDVNPKKIHKLCVKYLHRGPRFPVECKEVDYGFVNISNGEIPSINVTDVNEGPGFEMQYRERRRRTDVQRTFSGLPYIVKGKERRRAFVDTRGKHLRAIPHPSTGLHWRDAPLMPDQTDPWLRGGKGADYLPGMDDPEFVANLKFNRQLNENITRMAREGKFPEPDPEGKSLTELALDSVTGGSQGEGMPRPLSSGTIHKMLQRGPGFPGMLGGAMAPPGELVSNPGRFPSTQLFASPSRSSVPGTINASGIIGQGTASACNNRNTCVGYVVSGVFTSASFMIVFISLKKLRSFRNPMQVSKIAFMRE